MKQISTNFFSGWRAPEYLLGFLFIVAPLYYHPNIGGEGLRIPNNATILLAALIFISYSLSRVLKSASFQLPRYFFYIAAFPILVTLAGIISGVDQPLAWLFRILFIWGGLAFFFSLFQHKLKQGRWDRVLLVLSLTGLIHASIGLLQIYLKTDLPFSLPKSPSGSPTGLFQQVNNQASYLATIISLSFYLASRPILYKRATGLASVVVLTVLFCSFIIGASGSRIGLLSLIISIPLVFICRKQQLFKNKVMLSALLISLILGFSIGLKTSTGSAIEKSVAVQSGYSGSNRLGIYNISIKLISEKPLFGHGITSFPQVFQNARPSFFDQHPTGVLPNKFVSHPHNEFLFWAVEGGLLGLAGLLACFVAMGISLIRLGLSRGGGGLSLLVPLFLHTQVELPMYVSSLSWFIFILLMAYSFSHQTRTIKIHLSLTATKTANISLWIATLLIGVLFIHTMRSNWELMDFYRNQADRENPFAYALYNPVLAEETEWINMSRIFYASMKLGLNKNVQLYKQWAEQKLVKRPDIDLYKKLAEAELYLNDLDGYCSLMSHAQKVYPKDKAFLSSKPQCKK